MKPIWYAILIVAILLGGILFLQVLPLVAEALIFANQLGIGTLVAFGSPEWVAQLTLFLWWTLVLLVVMLIIAASFHKGR